MGIIIIIQHVQEVNCRLQGLMFASRGLCKTFYYRVLKGMTKWFVRVLFLVQGGMNVQGKYLCPFFTISLSFYDIFMTKGNRFPVLVVLLFPRK